MKPKTRADGYHSITPYLKLPNSQRLLEFLKQAFDAVEKGRLTEPDGSLLHVEVLIGDSMVMVHESPPGWNAKPCTLYLRVDDADATYHKAIATAAKPVFEPADTYYGSRVGCVTDPAGNDWWISSPLQEMTLDEIQRRSTEYLKAKSVQAAT